MKIIKPGMDSRQVIARFRAEQQALAMMDHPNIARVFEVGTTENGRPYFVMELVKGIPITKYCDDNQLSTKERLHLFSQVTSSSRSMTTNLHRRSLTLVLRKRLATNWSMQPRSLD